MIGVIIFVSTWSEYLGGAFRELRTAVNSLLSPSIALIIANVCLCCRSDGMLRRNPSAWMRIKHCSATSATSFSSFDFCKKMAIDWGAPGSKDTPANRHKYALEASGLSEEEYNDPIFRAACNKYKQLQNSSSVIGQIIETYVNKIHEMLIILLNCLFLLFSQYF